MRVNLWHAALFNGIDMMDRIAKACFCGLVKSGGILRQKQAFALLFNGH